MSLASVLYLGIREDWRASMQLQATLCSILDSQPVSDISLTVQGFGHWRNNTSESLSERPLVDGQMHVEILREAGEECLSITSLASCLNIEAHQAEGTSFLSISS